MRIQLNGEPYELPDGESVAALLGRLELAGRRVAVELNTDIVPRSQHESTRLSEGDRSKWSMPSVAADPPGDSPASPVTFSRGSTMSNVRSDKPFTLAGRTFQSRLLVGTGKYRDMEETRLAIEASGAEIVTVAVRRTNIGQNPGEPNLLDVLPPDRYTILPNTAGCYDAVEAVRTAAWPENCSMATIW